MFPDQLGLGWLVGWLVGLLPFYFFCLLVDHQQVNSDISSGA